MFPPCFLTLDQTMVEVRKIMATSFKRSHECTAALSAPDPAAGHHPPMPPLETPGHSQASLGQSLAGSLLLSPGSWCAQGFVCALQESVSPVLCKFWWLCGGVNGDLLQEGLCHTQVCMPYPGLLHPEPLPPQQPTADPCLCWRLLENHRQVWVSLLWGHCSFLLGSGVHKVLFVPSKSLFP